MRKSVTELCREYGIDVAQLRLVEDMVNDGRVVLRGDHWQRGKLMFFSGPLRGRVEPIAPLTRAQLPSEGEGRGQTLAPSGL